MADLDIDELTFPSTGENIQRDDLVHIYRNGDYKAKLAGALLLPAFTSADAGKRLEVNAGATAAFWVDPNAGTGWALRATNSGIGYTGAGSFNFSPAAAGFSIADYTDIHLQFTTGGDGAQTFGLRMMPIINETSYSSDGNWWARPSTATAIAFGAPNVGTITTIHTYGRIG